jgi:DNA-binding transcriptional LysR family regulator
MANPSPWFLRARLKPRQMMLLNAISEEGNIHRAAAELNISQPAASKLLKDLEDVLGIQLFDRLPRGMRPTWYGETLVRHSRMALTCLRQAGQEIEAIKHGKYGEVGVGAIIGPAMSLMPHAFSIVALEQPNLRVKLIVDSSDILLESLMQGKLDIVVGRLFESIDKTNLLHERLADEPVCAVVRPGHPLINAQDLKLKQLENAPWIVPPMGSVLRHRFEMMFHDAGLSTPRQLIESAALIFITKMLQQSDFIAIVPADVGRYYAAYGMLATLPIQLSCTMDAFGIITRKDWLLSPGAQVVLKAIKTAAIATYHTIPDTKQ